VARLRRQLSVVHCDYCERTLLLGESVATFRDGRETRLVCALCEGDALKRGWLRDGQPDPPPQPREPRAGLIERLRRQNQERRTKDPAARPAPRHSVGVVKLTGEEAAAASRAKSREVERAELAAQAVELSLETFNASAYRRTVQGIARTLGAPRVSLVPLGGIRPDVVITIAWDISWYQYRVDAEADPPVRLEGRGDDVTELAQRWRTWNAQHTEESGLVLG
jgi:hypothetical protein